MTADELTQVVTRLKEQGMNEQHDDEARGAVAGGVWAKHHAGAKQLRRLEEGHDDDTFSGEPDAYGWAGVVYSLITGEQGDCGEINDFWKTVLGDDDEKIYDGDFARGFVAGALEVWHMVKSKI